MRQTLWGLVMVMIAMVAAAAAGNGEEPLSYPQRQAVDGSKRTPKVVQEKLEAWNKSDMSLSMSE